MSELLGCQPLVGSMATKERVMSALTQAECVHFATHVSWKLSALVLTPNTEGNTASSKSSFGHPYTIPESLRVQDDASDVESISDCPPLRELLLTAADLLDLRLSVKLVVLSSSQEANSRVTADGLVALTRAFLAAGAQCVLVALWPVPVAASKMFVHAFYSSLLNGLKASASLGEAMKAVQSSKAFSHPSNWAGREWTPFCSCGRVGVGDGKREAGLGCQGLHTQPLEAHPTHSRSPPERIHSSQHQWAVFVTGYLTQNPMLGKKKKRDSQCSHGKV